MALFLSTFAKKIDKKGRVSVPAQFRAAMQDESFGGIVVYPSFIHSCVEACSMSRIKKLSDSIDNLDPFSEERDAFATAVLGGSSQLQFDSEGRVMLPLELLEQGGITEDVVFVGKGQTFEIWEPKRFEIYSKNAREVALQKRASLKLGGGNNA
jgi:MraZ protein